MRLVPWRVVANNAMLEGSVFLPLAIESAADGRLMMEPDKDRQGKLANLANCKAQAEKRYDEMYEAHSFSHAGACYSEVKEFFYEAIKLAEELGMVDEAASIRQRLQHINAVFRSQFVQ